MSAKAAKSTSTSVRRAPKPKPAPRAKPALRVVDAVAERRARRRRNVMSVSFFVLVCTMFGVAMLYGQLVQGQQRLDEMRSQITEAEAERHRLERQVAIDSTPAAIMERATEIGMVRAVEPQFLFAVSREASAPPTDPATSAIDEALGAP